MLDVLRIVNGLFLTLSLSFFRTLLDWSLVCLLILVFLSPILLIIVIWVLELCHYSTLPMYLVLLIKFLRYFWRLPTLLCGYVG